MENRNKIPVMYFSKYKLEKEMNTVYFRAVCFDEKKRSPLYETCSKEEYENHESGDNLISGKEYFS